MKNKELHEQARRLVEVTAQLDIMTSLLSCLEYSVFKNDMFIVNAEIQQGLLGKIRDNLLDINERVGSVSNTICPDDDSEVTV